MAVSDYTIRVLIASKVKGVGRKTLQALTREPLFFQVKLEELAETFPELAPLQPASMAFDKAVKAAEDDLAQASGHGHTILSPLDPDYPKLLAATEDRPALLYVAGDPARFSTKAIAVIGTREPSEHGIETARRITQYFVKAGWQIVSGLALGLDSVAHKETLNRDGSTVAAMAHGLDAVYPKSNASLADAIVEKGGLLVSEYAYGTPAFSGQFVERDRIQAALSRAVVMAQSDRGGGSLHASRAALRYGRFLVVPVATQMDIASGYEKARGNIALTTGSVAEKLSILKCQQADLERLIVLRSRNDYETIESTLLA
ncbi:Rossmann fold nucleotide-binding protein [Paraburkholderia hospita]|uniref:Rossmann fold nucleotide-binding protein n=1 Tax=Paraburkholderia hospita TaxID=169430 RepID=A0ABP2PT89_9BURK|nr:DNA-processing protein DprA [Paraburkholderia hospita]EIN00441.1 Rossmann fold nucleotide-binding protein [Paraburkholderia hospita]